MKNRNDINGLRGLSILFIYFYHSSDYLCKSGFMAVDMFILLSGYFTLYSRSCRNILTYIFNRIKKLIPDGYIILLFCYVISNIYIPSSRLEIIYNDLLSSFLGKSNIYFYEKTVNYFGDSLNVSINLHYWYFCLQEQLYIFSALLIICQSKDYQISIELLFFIYSLLFSIVNYKNNLNGVYFLASGRLWEFIFGIFIYKSKISMNNKQISNLSTVVYVFLIFLSKKDSTIFPFPINALYLLLGSIILINNSNSFLGCYLYQFFGDISFSIYLIHYPLLFLNKLIFGYSFLAMIVYTLSLSYICYIFIENSSIINGLYPQKLLMIFTVVEVSIVVFLKVRIKSISYSKKYLTRTMAKEEWKNVNYLFKLDKYNFTNNAVLFMGDSHIIQWIPVILKNKNVHYYNLVYFHYWIHHIIYENHQNLLKAISLIEIKYIIMSNYLANCSKCNIKNYSDLYKPFIYFINTIKEYVLHYIYIIQDIPYHFKDVFVKPNDGINYAYSILGINSSVNSFPYIKSDKIIYINTTKWICYNRICKLFKDYYSVYVGSHHLTITFTLSLSYYLNKELIFVVNNNTKNKSYILRKDFVKVF